MPATATVSKASAPSPTRSQRLGASLASRGWPAERIVEWAAPLALVVLAALVRLWHLDYLDHLVFDETYYVKDAYALYTLGYEGKWAEGANDLFHEGDTSALSDEPSYVVHPALGKWIIGLCIGVFGIDSPWAWRLPTAIVGILIVAVVYFVARAITGSLVWGSLAGFLMAIDSQAIVMSRTALLDNVLALFALLGVAFVFLDRRDAPARAVRHWHEHRSWRPVFWSRPWLVAAGIAFGAAAAVKWSGLYYLAAFGLWSVFMDIRDQRRASGSDRPWWGLLTQGPASFVLMVGSAAVTWFVANINWFISHGYGYDWAFESPENRVSWLPNWLPESLHSFMHYQEGVFGFHVALDSEHPFSSRAIEWLPMLRPTGFDSSTVAEGIVSFQSVLPNPFIWWAAGLAVIAAIYCLGRTRNRTLGALLLAIVAGYGPWLYYHDRTIFSFYTIIFEPFMILVLVWMLRWLWQGLPGHATSARWRRIVTWVIYGWVVVVSLAYFFFGVTTYGYPMADPMIQLRYWLTGWR